MQFSENEYSLTAPLITVAILFLVWLLVTIYRKRIASSLGGSGGQNSSSQARVIGQTPLPRGGYLLVIDVSGKQIHVLEIDKSYIQVDVDRCICRCKCNDYGDKEHDN